MHITKADLFDSLAGAATRSPANPSEGSPAALKFAPYLKSSASTLWAKHPPASHTREERRHALLAALTWLGEKNNWEVLSGKPQPYVSAGQKIKGKLALTWQKPEAALIFEIIFDIKEPVIEKLWAAHQEGKHPVLFIGGVAATAPIYEKLTGLNRLWRKWLTVIPLA